MVHTSSAATSKQQLLAKLFLVDPILMAEPFYNALCGMNDVKVESGWARVGLLWSPRPGFAGRGRVVDQLCIAGFITSPTRKRGLHSP